MLNHLQGLKRIGSYKAPDDGIVKPVKIPSGIELVELITGGQVWFENDGVKNVYERGTVFWHKGGENTIWETTPDAPYRCMVFNFMVNDGQRPTARVGRWNSDIDIDLFSTECLKLFYGHYLPPDILAVYVYSSLLKAVSMQQPVSARDDYPKPLLRALTYIQKHYNTKFSIDDLAFRSGVSAPHLFRLFRRYLGITPHQYILSAQMAWARTALVSTDKTIQEIAFESGFENLEVFYRCFRKENGMPPGEYRRMHMPYRFA